MKKMKKLAALFMSIIMMMALAVTATAINITNETGTVTISNAAAGETYTLYRVFDMSFEDDATNPTRFIFKTNEKWKSFAENQTSYVEITNTIVNPVGLTTEAQAKSFAAAVAAANIDSDAEVKATSSGSTVQFDNLPYGYYVMKVTKANNEAGHYNVFTLGKATLSIKQKNVQFPSIEKTVNGVKDLSAGSSDTLTYTITVRAAAGTDTYIITDSIPTGITHSNDVTVNDATQGTDYTITTTSNEIKITLDSDYRAKLTQGQEVVITYTAKLNSSATAGVAMSNTATLDSDGDDKTASATVKTGSLTFDKVEENTSNKLSGAEFVLLNSAKDAYAVVGNDGLITEWASETTTSNNTIITTDGNNSNTFKWLAAGTYYLREVKAPAGYTGVKEDIEITISDNAFTKDVENTKGTTLPETGGMGTTIFYIAGSILMLGAAVLLITKKRTKAE